MTSRMANMHARPQAQQNLPRLSLGQRLSSLARLRHHLALVILLGIAIALVFSGRMTVFTIDVGQSRYSHADLAKVLEPFTTTNLWQQDMNEIKGTLLQLVGVGDVALQRHWPNRINAVIIPDQVVALVNQDQVLTSYWRMHTSEEWARVYPDHLTIYDYPKFTVAPSMIPDRLDWLMSIYQTIDSKFQELDLVVAEIRATETESISAVTTQGITVQLCRGQLVEKLQRFGQVWHLYLATVREQISSLSLCYPNGLAWQPNIPATSEVHTK